MAHFYSFVKFVIVFITCFICLSILGCSSFLMPPLQVVSVHFRDSVEVLFSAEPQLSSIQNAFSLTEDAVIVSGYFKKNGNTVMFYPVNGIQENRDYVLTVSEYAEDTKGNSLIKEYKTVYSTRKEDVSPVITSVTPVDETVVDSISHIQFSFSESINTSSFYRSFSASPSFEYIVSFLDNNKIVKLTPTSPLTPQERYTLRLSTELTDTNHNALLKEYTTSFYYVSDKEPPTHTLSSLCSSGYSALIPNESTEDICSSEFLLTFNEEISIDSLSHFISIEPSLMFSVTATKENPHEARIVLDEEPEWGSSYNIHVRKGIEDVSQNKTTMDTTYTVVFNNEKKRPVAFIAALLKTGIETKNQDYFEISSKTDYSTLVFNVTSFPPTSENNEVVTDLYFFFAISKESAGITEISAKEAINIFTTNNCATFILNSIKVLTEEEYKGSEIALIVAGDERFNSTETKTSVIKATVEISNTYQEGLIHFFIDKHISDSNKNTLVNSFEATVNKK